MDTHIHVEPAAELRPRFALWTLSAPEKIDTTSTGFSVPLAMYPGIPAELLEGAYIDGYPMRRAEPAKVEPVKPEPEPEAATTTPRKRTQRARKASE